jgi:hypothetical protein
MWWAERFVNRVPKENFGLSYPPNTAVYSFPHIL